MHNQPIGDPSIEDRDAVVLDLLLIEHDGLWSISELQQLVGDAVGVDDALARLHTLGLIHRLEDFVFASPVAAHVTSSPARAPRRRGGAAHRGSSARTAHSGNTRSRSPPLLRGR